ILLLAEFAGTKNAPPVIVVTGRGDEDTAARCLHAGAAGYVIKDESLASTLLHTIDRALELSRAECALRESELRYRRIFETATDGIILLDAGTGEIEDVNPGLEKMLGYPRAELVGRKFWEVGFLEDSEFAKSLFSGSGRDTRRHEHLTLRSRGGDEIWVDFRSETYDEDQRKVIWHSIRDITERRKSNQALRDSEAKYRFLAENMNDIVWTADLAFTTTYVSPSIESVLGYPPAVWMGMRLEEQMAPESLLMAAERLSEELRRDGERDPFRTDVLDLYYYDICGDARCLETSLSFIRSDDGAPTGIYGLSRDVTMRVRAEETIRRQAAELRDLVDVAAHELRHPATIFKGYASVLMRYGDQLDSEIARDAISAIDRGADRLSMLINKLLDTSSIDSGGVVPDLAEVDPWTLARAAVEQVESESGASRFVLRPRSEDWTAYMDEGLIREVLAVILDNALKHTPEDTPIDVACERLAAETKFSVTDAGPGIPENAREMIFQRFYQVEDASHHSKPGLGLGLYIARNYVEAHHGWVRVEPVPGGGSRFCFAIPNHPDG
ncbi:MAG: sensor histidine kinase, partial [Candidatus Geothermincolia bacterium]